jgi:hypothetical protein
LTFPREKFILLAEKFYFQRKIYNERFYKSYFAKRRAQDFDWVGFACKYFPAWGWSFAGIRNSVNAASYNQKNTSAGYL